MVSAARRNRPEWASELRFPPSQMA